MINKRYKKKKQVKDLIQINRSSKSDSSSILNNIDETLGGPAVGAADRIASGLSSSTSSKINDMIDKQLKGIQASADLRASSETSNLDTLDRGSRYIRKNKKLKAFNDAKAAKV